MQRRSGIQGVILAIGACTAAGSAMADNPVGFYLGAGGGYSTIRSDDPGYGLPGYYNDHQTAWKAIAGVRPISLIGAEFEYIDFGRPGNDYSNSYAYYGRDSHPRASMLFGIGYLPLPIPLLDIYGKAGVAQLRTDVFSYTATTCLVSDPNCPAGYSRQTKKNNKFAYGAGVQSKVWGVAFRAEYERISSPYGDPDAVTVSATWTF